MRWNLNDLTTGAELARVFKVSRAAINMWAVRYPDFPAPLVRLGNIPLYSRKQVRAWRKIHARHLGEPS